MGTVGPNAIFVNVGSAVPPMIVGDTEEEREAQARDVAFVPIRPIARFAITPAGLDELITMLEGTRENYETVRQTMKDQGRS